MITLLILELFEQKFKQSFGKGLGQQICKSSISLFRMNFNSSDTL